MVRPGAWPSAQRAWNADAFEDLDHLWCVAPLARRDQEGQRAAAAFAGEMDFAGQAAPGPSESFVGAVVPGRCPFFGTRGFFLRAPAACWWARQDVESTLTMLQSIRPARSASAWTACRIRSHVPSADQRRCRS
ncbi:hypothetical protein ADK53_34895 [Streptomyces sp. WM6373]|nr:hypothetical protein ADK53_34895 [Streptomyces sp. WM6373]KOU69758.1 hypothetical protein ADK61_36550 [Streptomyces sp. XY66]